MARPRSLKIDNPLMWITIALLFVLEGFYLNNVFSQRPDNTGALQAILLLLSVFLIIFKLKTRKTTLVLSGLMLCINMFVSASFNIESAKIGIFLLISKCFLWFAVFLVGYVSTRFLDGENFIPKIVVIACVAFLFIILTNNVLDLNIYKRDTVVTAIYYLICCAPFLLCMKQKKVRNVMLAIIVLLLFFSFKRSALLVAGVSAIALFIINNKKTRKIKYYAIVGLVALTMLFFIYVSVSSGSTSFTRAIEVWMDRFSEGGGARFNIWGNVIDLIRESNIFQNLFGHGYNAVMNDSISRLSAHNDFLEVLYDYGFIAFVVLIVFVGSLIKNGQAIAKADWSVYNGYVCALVVFIVASLVSHMLTYSTYFMILSLYFGYANGIEEKKLQKAKFE